MAAKREKDAQFTAETGKAAVEKRLEKEKEKIEKGYYFTFINPSI
ncbi:MAG: hypothetical protein WA667_18020 [Candidatus Nitrosopolaris sp.]